MTKYEVSTQSGKPNTTFEFTFKGANVASYVVGLSYWKLGLRSGAKLQDVKLRISSTSDGHTVRAIVSADLDGGALSADSTVHVSCLAALGDPDANSTLTGVQGILDGGSSRRIPLCTATPGIEQAVLAGFDVAYPGSASHKIQGTHMGVAFKRPDATAATGELRGSVGLSGHTDPYDCSVDGGLVYLDKSAGVTVEPVGSEPVQSDLVIAQTATCVNQAAVTFNMGAPLRQAAVFIQSMSMSYGNTSRFVGVIGGGAESWSLGTGAGNMFIKVGSGQAFLSDGQGHTQDRHASVTLLAVGIPV